MTFAISYILGPMYGPAAFEEEQVFWLPIGLAVLTLGGVLFLWLPGALILSHLREALDCDLQTAWMVAAYRVVVGSKTPSTVPTSSCSLRPRRGGG